MRIKSVESWCFSWPDWSWSLSYSSDLRNNHILPSIQLTPDKSKSNKLKHRYNSNLFCGPDSTIAFTFTSDMSNFWISLFFSATQKIRPIWSWLYVFLAILEETLECSRAVNCYFTCHAVCLGNWKKVTLFGLTHPWVHINIFFVFLQNKYCICKFVYIYIYTVFRFVFFMHFLTQNTDRIHSTSVMNLQKFGIPKNMSNKVAFLSWKMC